MIDTHPHTHRVSPHTESVTHTQHTHTHTHHTESVTQSHSQSHTHTQTHTTHRHTHTHTRTSHTHITHTHTHEGSHSLDKTDSNAPSRQWANTSFHKSRIFFYGRSLSFQKTSSICRRWEVLDFAWGR